MCSYLVYILASQEAVWIGLEPQRSPMLDAPMYRTFPKLTKEVGLRILCHINNAFLMEIVRKIDGKLELWVSPEAVALVLRFGHFYI